MPGLLRTRWQQGYRTIRYPDGPPPALPPRFAGGPVIGPAACAADCQACREACPTDALRFPDGPSRPRLDLGRCIFCRACETVCPSQVIHFGEAFRLAGIHREDLVVGRGTEPACTPGDGHIRKLFGRSLKLRQVSAGGCNACEADTHVLTTLAWDLGRFGIQFVASPRHADGLLITGPVPRNMELALRKTYEAVPAPKIVVAVGACAISGGIYRTQPETCAGAAEILPVDLFIPGCPPHPLTILDGLLRLLGKGGTPRQAGGESGGPDHD